MTICYKLPQGEGNYRKVESGVLLELIETEEQAQALCDHLLEYRHIVIDFETNGLHHMDPNFRVVGCAFAADSVRGYYVPFDHRPPVKASLFGDDLKQIDRATFLRIFRPIWEERLLICHNAKYEAQCLLAMGEEITHHTRSPKGGGIFFDTYIAANVVESRFLSTELKALTMHLFRRSATTFRKATKDKIQDHFQASKYDFTHVEMDVALSYAAPDGTNCYRLFQLFSRAMSRPGEYAQNCANIFYNYEMPLVDVVARLERSGMRLDEDLLHEIHKMCNEECGEKERVMKEILYEYNPEFEQTYGMEFSPSTDALYYAMDECLGIPNPKATISEYPRDTETLSEILAELTKGRKYDKRKAAFVQALVDWSRPNKIRSTYTTKLISRLIEGRIFPELGQVKTKSGRCNSENPNGQNMPGKGDKYKVRRALLPPFPDWVWIISDFAALEMRILAALSGCPVLSGIITGSKTIYDLDGVNGPLIEDPEAWEKAEYQKLIKERFPEEEAAQQAKFIDIHRYTASAAFQVPYDRISNSERDGAKPINFGIIYGITEVGLSAQISQKLGKKVSPQQTKKFIDGYMQGYPGVKAFIDRTQEEVWERKRVCTPQGRYRHVPRPLLDKPKQKYGGVFRWAVNHKVQGCGGYITKQAMLNFDKLICGSGLRALQVLQVHDELNIAAHKDDAEQVGEILVRSMNTELNGIPIITDGYKIAQTLEK